MCITGTSSVRHSPPPPNKNGGEGKKKESDSNEENCSICLETLEQYTSDGTLAVKSVSVLPCSHKLHTLCWLQWLRTNDTCPACRTPTTANSGIVHCYFPKPKNK